MQKGNLNKVFTVVLCVWALVAVAAGQGDANAPGDLGDYFEPYWSSVVLESRLYNPVEEPDRDPNTQITLAISGGVRILDESGLIGVQLVRNTNVVALDQDGAEIYRAADASPISRWYQRLEDAKRLIGGNQRADEFWLSLDIPMDAELGYPSALSRVEWSMDVLMADEFATVDVPFEPNETWIELIPGLEILVEQASVQEGSYQYRIEAIYDPNLVSYTTVGMWHFWAHEVPAPVMLVEMDMLNADGQSVRELSSPNSSGGSSTSGHTSEGVTHATSTGSASCSACGDVTTIRYTFALAPYERSVTLALENVPVPGF